MMTNAQLREYLRPQGIVSPSCKGCHWLADCGGYHNGRLFSNCFEENCCHFTGKDKGQCNAVCPYKHDFDDWLGDTGGIRFDDLSPIVQSEIELPAYVPLVDHRSSRKRPLNWPMVALNTYNVMRIARGPDSGYKTVAPDPSGLRDAFLLDRQTKIVLRGVARDNQLERYWEHRIVQDAPHQLVGLNVHAAIGPNFSHYLNVPRPDNLWNRRRQLLCLGELSNAGLVVIPHLNAVMPGDWTFWIAFLRKNATIRSVAIEFQTGNKKYSEGRKAIDCLSFVQAALGRALHLILVGGSQFIEYAAIRFPQVSLIDSVPFFKTMHRSHGEPKGRTFTWKEGFSLAGQPLDEWLLVNIQQYASWIDARIQYARETGGHSSLSDGERPPG